MVSSGFYCIAIQPLIPHPTFSSLQLDLLREHLDVRQSDDGGAVVTPKSDPKTFKLLSELSLPAVSALAMESVVATAVRSRVKCSVSLEAVSDTHHVLLAGTKV